ncbi:MAG TPA: hypothetical protein VM532_18675 [Burkholderiales bacterium]|nr:hypothetical protein [Burkholderiales bacterium]
MATEQSPKKKPKINKPPVLFAQSQAIVAKIEKKLKSGFITYWNSPGGEVCQNDVVGFYELLRGVGKRDHLYLFIKSNGGRGTASLRIVHLLRQHAKRLTVLAPLECVSAATMIALGADEIQMGQMAYLSAVDTSLTHDLSPVDKDNRRVSVSQNELSRILKVWGQEAKGDKLNPYSSIFQHIHPLVIGAVDRASSLSIRLCQEILSYHMKSTELANKISQTLNSDYPSHTYPITLNEAQRIGLNAKELDPALDALLIELNAVYAEMGQRALTDYDEANYHDNEILNILEVNGTQLFYQTDKDWHYRTEERRWIPLNDHSDWRKVEKKDGKVEQTIVHIR